MDPVSIAKDVGGLVARPAFDAAKGSWQYVKEYDSNLDDVQKLHKSLKKLKDETKQKVEEDEKNKQTVKPEVKEWLEEVDTFMESKEEGWEDLLLDKEARKKAAQCCFGFCWSPKYKYSVSKKAEAQADNIEELIEELTDGGKGRRRDTKSVDSSDDDSSDSD